MWLFTPQGFISAVQHKDDPEQIVVRARDLSQLQSMFPAQAHQIIKMEWADYPHRIHIPRVTFVEWMARQAEALDYPDFKSSIPPDANIYKSACHQVWDTMHALQYRPITR